MHVYDECRINMNFGSKGLKQFIITLEIVEKSCLLSVLVNKYIEIVCEEHPGAA